MKRMLSCALATLTVLAVALPADAAARVRDGRIAFWDFTSRQIYSIRPDGGGLHKLTHVPAGQVAANPSWSRDGRRIAFQTFFLDGSQEDRIWIMKANGTGARKVIADPGFADSVPQFTPDGKRLLFARCASAAEQCAIASVRTDGTGLRLLTPLTDEVFDVSPVISSTGRIAFTRFNADGVVAQIFVLDAHGSAHAVTPRNFGADLPKWSPDGTKIVVESCCQLSRDVYTIAPNGSHLRQITHTAYPKSRRWPAYSATGSRLVYVGEKKPANPYVTSDLFISSSDGTHEKLLPTGLGNPVGPVWQRATNE